MLSLVGSNEVYKVFCTLAYNYLNKNKEITPDSLKKAIKEYLVNQYPFLPYSEGLKTEIIQSGNKLTKLIQVFDLEKEIRINFDGDSKPHSNYNLDLLNKAMRRMENLNELYSVFYLSIDTIALTNNIRFPGSASTPDAIGFIWLQPEEVWTELDMLESLIHELTHTLLGYDNLVHKHYRKPSEILNRNTWVPSAIRKELRPVNGVAHSILVGTELLNFRKNNNIQDHQINVHGSTQKLFNNTKRAIESLKSSKDSWDILSSRMQHLLNIAYESLNKLNIKETNNGLYESKV